MLVNSSKKHLYYFRTMIFMILFSQYLKNVTFPLPVYRRYGSNKGFGTVRVNLIQLFPVSYTCLPERDYYFSYLTWFWFYNCHKITGATHNCCNVGFMCNFNSYGSIKWEWSIKNRYENRYISWCWVVSFSLPM